MRVVRRSMAGFMLPELLICVAMLAIAIAALLGAFLGQLMLNEHARNLTWAVHDANRVMERLRQENTGGACTLDALPPAPTGVGTCTVGNTINSWDQWLRFCGGGKSIQPNPNTEELIVVTCQDSDGTPNCGNVDQVGAGEWAGGMQAGVNTDFDPIRVTVSVCWRHRSRVIGECTWNGAALSADDSVAMPGEATNLNGVIESPATLVTLMTCRR